MQFNLECPFVTDLSAQIEIHLSNKKSILNSRETLNR